MFDNSREESCPVESDLLCTVFEHLRAPRNLAPAPGFYGRVRSQIQEIKEQSIWVPLIYSPFPWRLVTACLALALGTLAYVFAAGWSPKTAIFSSANPHHRRDAVLAEIVTYRKPN